MCRGPVLELSDVLYDKIWKECDGWHANSSCLGRRRGTRLMEVVGVLEVGNYRVRYWIHMHKIISEKSYFLRHFRAVSSMGKILGVSKSFPAPRMSNSSTFADEVHETWERSDLYELFIQWEKKLRPTDAFNPENYSFSPHNPRRLGLVYNCLHDLTWAIYRRIRHM